MGGRRAGLRHIFMYPIAINTCSSIVQGRGVTLFRHLSLSCTIIPDIFSLGGRVSGMGYISNSIIITNIISCRSQQHTTFTLVIGVVVAGLIPISTSPLNINSYSPIEIVIVAGLLWPRSTFISMSPVIKIGIVAGIKIRMSTTSVITRGIVAGLKRPVSTTFLTWRHFKTFFFINFIIVATNVGGRIYGFKIPLSYASITTHRK